MGTPGHPDKALLFVGVLYSDENFYIKAYQLLEDSFGKILMHTPALIWDYSDYYKEELGSPIYRRFLFFANLLEQDSLCQVKLLTNKLEQSLSINGKRSINLDPGYLTPAKIVLASTKDYSHRVYLRDGIYAEVTMMYDRKKGQYMPHINTYRDYSDGKYQEFFLKARRLSFLLNETSMPTSQHKRDENVIPAEAGIQKVMDSLSSTE